MNFTGPSERLNHISTLWTLVGRANQTSGDEVARAQEQLLERYGGAIRRYLLGALRDEEAADELFQEFAVRFLKGDLRGADPDRGRFRDFVKGVLGHLVADYHNRKRRQPGALPDGHEGPAVDPPTLSDLDQTFVTHWRDELLARAWAGLARVEAEHGQPLYTVLRFRSEHPELPSGVLAVLLGEQLGREVTAVWVRQTLHRARERFAELLVDEVFHALDTPTPERLEAELMALRLFEHCRPALERRGGRE